MYKFPHYIIFGHINNVEWLNFHFSILHKALQTIYKTNSLKKILFLGSFKIKLKLEIFFLLFLLTVINFWVQIITGLNL